MRPMCYKLDRAMIDRLEERYRQGQQGLNIPAGPTRQTCDAA